MQDSLIKEIKVLLFVSEVPISVKSLCETLEKAEEQVLEALKSLEQFLEEHTPLQLIYIAGGYQLCTQKQYAHLVTRFLQPQKARLSRSLLEVLSIVAYHQPITIAEVEAIRGVQSDYGLRQLVDRQLVQELGHKQTPGRPTLYGTTSQFLHAFNLKSLEDLPPLERVDTLAALTCFP